MTDNATHAFGSARCAINRAHSAMLPWLSMRRATTSNVNFEAASYAAVTDLDTLDPR